MFKVIVLSAAIASTAAFQPARMARPSFLKIAMSAESLSGQSAPLGYFDPLGLSADKSDGDVRVKK